MTANRATVVACGDGEGAGSVRGGGGGAARRRRAPLAARLRPRTLDEVVGQEHLLGPGRPLRALIEADRLSSVILWGPPGTGKTTIARLIAGATEQGVRAAVGGHAPA